MNEKKRCNYCLKEKPLIEFHKYARAKDGRQYRCKVCQCEIMREHQRQNPESNLKRVTRWRKDRPTWYGEYGYMQIKASHANLRARRFNVPGRLHVREIVALFESQRNRCLCCGQECPLTIDHVLPFKHPHCTNTIDNIQGLCMKCNMSKAQRTFDYRKAA